MKFRDLENIEYEYDNISGVIYETNDYKNCKELDFLNLDDSVDGILVQL